MGFKERLKAERQGKRLTQQELADRIKTTNTCISNWEKGVSSPSASIVKALADALGVNPYVLIGDYTLNDLQELEAQDASALSYEDSLALEFARDIFQTLAERLGEGFRQIDDEMRKFAKDVVPLMQPAATRLLYADGGEQVLFGYQYLNRAGKALLLDCLSGLLRTPSLVDTQAAVGGEAEQVSDLLSIKEQLLKGAD